MTFFEAVKMVNSLAMTAYTIADGNSELNNVEFIDSSSDILREDTLYFCEPETLPRYLPEEQLYSFFVFGTLNAAPAQFRALRVNLVTIDRTIDQVTVMNGLKRRLHEEAQLRSNVMKLTSALFSNRGLQHIIKAAYDILKNPIIVWDNGENCLAKEIGDTAVDPASNFAYFLKTEAPDPDEDAKAVDYVKSLPVTEDSPVEDPVTLRYNEYFGLDQMVGCVRVSGVTVARVSMFSYNHPFTAADERMFRELLPFIGQELQKNTQFKKNRNENKAYFLNALLSINNITQPAIDRMLLFRNIANIKDKFYVVVVEPNTRSEQIDPMIFQTVAQQLKPALSGSFYLIRDTELVILLNLPNNRHIQGFIDEALVNQVRTNNLLIGVSNMFRDLTETRKHYRQAKDAIDLNVAYHSWEVAYFSMIAPVRVLHIVREHDDLLSFCTPQLLDLLRVDEQSNLDYMITLYYYLEYFGSSSAAAAKLHVHKNTLLYRLGKIKEIIGCDLTKGEDIYKFMMGFRILRTLNMFKLREYEGREWEPPLA